MRYLIDTHVFIFWLSNRLERLQTSTIDTLSSADNEIFVSDASAYETALKVKLGKLTFPVGFADHVVDAGFKELPLTAKQAEMAGNFELEHRDPFDRMLAAQSIEQRMPLITSDQLIATFGVDIVEA